MSISFESSLPLIMAGVILLPLLLHLFARSRPPRYQFTAVSLLARLVRQSVRARRPRDLLVLALRTLLMAALAALIFQPILFLNRKLSDATRRNVVVIVDRSASMAYAEGGQSRFSAACADAVDFLGGLKGNDTANVIWLDSNPDAVFSGMGVNTGWLSNELRKGRVSSEGAAIEAAFSMAAAMLEESEGYREICVVSDFQASAWEFFKPPELEGISVVLSPVGEGMGANVAVGELRCVPATPLCNEDVEVEVEVHNFSAKAVQRLVYVSSGTQRQSRRVALQPWSSALCRVPVSWSTPGLYQVDVEIEEDMFTGDDRASLALEVRTRQRVALCGKQSASGKIWERLLHALPWIEVHSLTIEEACKGGYDTILVAEWDGKDADLLRERLQRKGALLVAPGNRIEGAGLAELVGSAPGSAGGLLQAQSLSDFAGRRLLRDDDPLFAVFQRGTHGDPCAGKVRQTLHIPEAMLESGEILLRHDNDVPALWRASGRINLYLWNVVLDPEFSTVALYPEFVILGGEILKRCRAADLPAAVEQRHPGDRLSWRVPSGISVSKVRLLDAAGQEVRVVIDGERELTAETPANPGCYRWVAGEEVLRYCVVPFSHGESDLRRMNPDKLKIEAVTVSGRQARDLREGVSIWPWFIAASALFLLLELLALAPLPWSKKKTDGQNNGG